MAPDKTSDSKSDDQTLSNIFLKSFGSSLSIWSLFLFAGGTVFAVYYARIGYLPDIELNSALSYLAAASILGGTVVVLLTLLLIIPGFIWARYLTLDPDFQKAFCENGVIAPKKFFARLIIWFFLFALVAHLALMSPNWILFSLSLSLFIPIAGLKAWQIRKTEIRECEAQPKTHNQMFLLYASRYSVSVLSGLLASSTLFKLLTLSSNKSIKAVMGHLFICTLGVTIANTVVTIFLHGDHRTGAFASALVLALALLACTDYIDPIPKQILGRFGFGQEHAQLIVTDDGYHALKIAGMVEETGTAGPKVVNDVQILCRMGPNYFVSKSGRRFTIRKVDVISWSVSP